MPTTRWLRRTVAPNSTLSKTQLHYGNYDQENHRQETGREEDHLNALDGGEIADELISILKIQKQGMTVREIAEALNIGKSTVQRRIDNARKSNVSIPEEETVPPVPNVPGVGQMGQAGYAGRA